MRPPEGHTKTGGRLSGYDVRQYMEDFAERFLKGRIRFETEVLNIRKSDDHGQGWSIHVRGTKGAQVLNYPRIVLCTGVRFILALLAMELPFWRRLFFSRGAVTRTFPSHYLPRQRRRQIFRALYCIRCTSRRGWMTYYNARHMLVPMTHQRL